MCEQIAPYVQLDTSLPKLAINSVRDRYELIHGNSARQQPVSQEIQYGWADGPIIDSFSGTMRLAGSTPRTPGRYSQGKSAGVKLGATNEMIHPSVQYRMQKRPAYRPEPLHGFTRQQKANGFEWKRGDIVVPEYRITSSEVFSRYIADQDRLRDHPKGEHPALKFIQDIDQVVGEKL